MNKRRIGVLLLIAEALLVLLVVRNFFYVTAWRLYLDGGSAQAGSSSAAQRFEVEAGRVLPVILTPEDDRMRFAVRVDRPSTLRFEARPRGWASYEVALLRGSAREVLARGEADRPVTVSQPLPPFDGVIELAGRGSLTWVDLRVVRDFRFVPRLPRRFALERRRARRRGGGAGRVPHRPRPAPAAAVIASTFPLEEDDEPIQESVRRGRLRRARPK